jgi:hypothetical protein
MANDNNNLRREGGREQPPRRRRRVRATHLKARDSGGAGLWGLRAAGREPLARPCCDTCARSNCRAGRVRAREAQWRARRIVSRDATACFCRGQRRKRLSAQDTYLLILTTYYFVRWRLLLFCSLARGGRWLDLLFSSPRPFPGSAFCSGRTFYRAPALPPPSLLPECSSSRQPRARRRACRHSRPPPPRARPREKRCGRT